MNQPWYIRLGWWLGEKLNHPFPRKGWIYNGFYHEILVMYRFKDHYLTIL